MHGSAVRETSARLTEPHGAHAERQWLADVVACEHGHGQQGAATQKASIAACTCTTTLVLVVTDLLEPGVSRGERFFQALLFGLELGQLEGQGLTIVSVCHENQRSIDTRPRQRPPPVLHVSRICTAPACGLRFPAPFGTDLGATCPRCGAPTTTSDPAFPMDERRPTETRPTGPPLEALFDNIRSLRNVGSMVRTADGAGVRHLHLCGITPTPDHPDLRKTALGAEQNVVWSYHRDAVAAATSLRDRGMRLWALEGTSGASPLFSALEGEASAIVLVLGHERAGVDPGVLRCCERVVRIPMHGTKQSLNVSVAFGVAAYALRYGWRS